MAYRRALVAHMLIQANNVQASLDSMLPGHEELLRQEIARALGVKASRVHDVRIIRKAVDARKKSNVHFVVNVQASVSGITHVGNLHPRKDVQLISPARAIGTFQIAHSSTADSEAAGWSALLADQSLRPIVVGAGPAGLFCALWLARAGLRPLVVERGKPVEERMRDVQMFAEGGALDTQSNIQFGEGGAGTFSDGKLTTGTKSPFARFVLEEFVACGAPEDILVDAKPHIGTDYLPKVVQNLRQRIVDAGGEVRFSTQLVGICSRQGDRSEDFSHRSEGGCQEDRSEGFSLRPEDENQEDRSEGFSLRSMQDGTCVVTIKDLTTGAEESIETNALVLAVGHSARDTFQMLVDEAFALERKPFAVGVRIEHDQAAINRAQYGPAAGHPALPPADYKLAVHNADGRGVYTFCMCPGGSVVAAASEAFGVCVNGMSTHARDGRNANSALLVEVRPDDFPQEEGVLAGVRFQRKLEQAAFEMGNMAFAAPAQTVGDFLNGESREDEDPLRSVQPTYPRGVRFTNLHTVLPSFVAEALEEALPKLGRKLLGFDAPEAIMTAVEARSSSPVRILRNRETLRSVSHPSVYPAGEGAGYAGGIMSAACDGIRVAEAAIADTAIRQTAAALRAGRPAVFPTDTVMGIGVAIHHSDDAKVLARIKGRDEGKPVAWLIGSMDDLERYGADVPTYASDLAREGWPGALTLIVKASDEVPRAFQSVKGTIGLRMPASKTALRLIEEAGSPLATTSANLAGGFAVSSLRELDADFVKRAQEAGALCVFADDVSTGCASTVIDCTGSEPRVLR